jgi:hypothetical protein
MKELQKNIYMLLTFRSTSAGRQGEKKTRCIFLHSQSRNFVDKVCTETWLLNSVVGVRNYGRDAAGNIASR